MNSLSQLEKYLPEQIRSQIEARYYAQVNEQARLDHLINDPEFLREPQGHVALISDHGVVHVRDVAQQVIRVLDVVNGVLIPARGFNRLELMKGYGVMVAYLHDIGMVEFSRYGRAMHPEYAAQAVLSPEFDEIIQTIWEYNHGNLAWRLANMADNGVLKQDPRIVLREMLAMAVCHSKSKVPVETLNDPDRLRQVMQETAGTALSRLYRYQRVETARRALETAQQRKDNQRDIDRFTQMLEEAESALDESVEFDVHRREALRRYYADFERDSFKWLVFPNEGTRNLVNDVVDTLRALRCADALRQRGTVLKTSGSYEIFVDQRTANAIFALRLGEVGVRSFYQPLLPLLQDDDSHVRRAAVLAAGQVKSSKLWPLVVEGLSSPGLCGAASTALVAGGQSALPELKVVFGDENQDRQVLNRAATVCGRIGGDEAIDLLKNAIGFPDPEVRTHVLAALSRCGYQSGDEERAIIQEQIQAEVVQAAWAQAAWLDIGNSAQNATASEALSLSRQALRAEFERCRERIFFLLSFIYYAQSVLSARDTLSRDQASAEKKAYALEVLDVLFSKELKPMLLPLVQDWDPEVQSHALSAFFPQSKLDRDSRLAEIIAGPDEEINAWIKACALYTVRRLSVTGLSETIAAALCAPDPLVRETAIWTLADLDLAMLIGFVNQLSHDPNPQVVRALRHLETSGDGAMLSTIEKVIILKKVSIFAGTPDEILAEVASLLEEVEPGAGETIFEKGDLGDCMYIIVDGEVRVHDGERTLNHLGEGDVFGEMALLDPEPRVASVTAIMDTRLFRLDQEPFYELMDDRIEVARGIIRVLTRHLRARVQDVADLHEQVQELAGGKAYANDK